uniref:Deacetylase sirtuin-type domain-containing protein n=1 Tax=Strigamia maritima TaxID=126957 RepID=T1IZX7_STRMM
MAYLLKNSRWLRKLCQNCRFMSSKAASNTVYCGKLSRRGLIQVTGNEASNFLQGLITNDMRHFDEHETALSSHANIKIGRPAQPLSSVSGPKKSMYSLILNIQGQILYDMILYNLAPGRKGSTNFLIECDAACLSELKDVLAKYRLRKKIELNDVTDQFTVWVLCNFPSPDANLPADVPPPEVVDPSKVTVLTKDPRTQSLGYRMILPPGIHPKVVLKDPIIAPEINDSYVNLRHRLGVWEGIDDVPPAQCYPLECNADYMHGVSFHKGCYVGQELTARTHHTGVIRKRVMPIVFEYEEKSLISKWTAIENELGRSVGRFISKIGKFGLAQIRLHEGLTSSMIQVKGYNGRLATYKPTWWPVEVPKENLVGGNNCSYSTNVWSVDDAVQLIKNEAVEKIVVMAGAGISTPSGLPDFRYLRTPGTGLYSQLEKYKLPYAEAIFDILYFENDQRPFFDLAQELYPGNYRPNITHYFVRLLQEKINYYGLAGIKPDLLIEAHGTFSVATCIKCRQTYDGEEVKVDIMKGLIPKCTKCKAVIKPDIVFFGEQLPPRFWTHLIDMPECDMLIVMGTSLEVEPFASCAEAVAQLTPRLLINQDAVGSFVDSERATDVVLEGDLVKNVELLVQKLNWSRDLQIIIDENEKQLINKYPKIKYNGFVTRTMNFNLQLLLLSCVFLSINVSITSCYLPVICIPGIADISSNLWSVCNEIKRLHPGTTVFFIQPGTALFSIFGMWQQVVVYKDVLRPIFQHFPCGVHILAHSQGVLIARAVIETTANHPVKSFLSVAAPFMGQYGIPFADYTDFMGLNINNLTREDVYNIAYTNFAQRTISIAGYWNDPTKQKLFLEKSYFLPYINNHLNHLERENYKMNFLRLHDLILIGGDGDEVIIPWQSVHAGFYDENLNIVSMKQQIHWKLLFAGYLYSRLHKDNTPKLKNVCDEIERLHCGTKGVFLQIGGYLCSVQCFWNVEAN